jgi:hypothetical protein
MRQFVRRALVLLTCLVLSILVLVACQQTVPTELGGEITVGSLPAITPEKLEVIVRSPSSALFLWSNLKLGATPVASYNLCYYTKISWRTYGYRCSVTAIPATATSYTLTGLTPGASYRYQVQARAADTTLLARTADAGFTMPAAGYSVLPGARLSVIATSSTSAKVSWVVPTGAASTSVPYASGISNITATSFTSTFVGSTYGVDLNYRLNVTKTDGSSYNAVSSSSKAPAYQAPFPVTATPLSSTSIKLSWNSSFFPVGGLKDASYLSVYQKQATGVADIHIAPAQISVAANHYELTISGLTANTPYSFYISGAISFGCHSLGGPITVQDVPGGGGGCYSTVKLYQSSTAAVTTTP